MRSTGRPVIGITGNFKSEDCLLLLAQAYVEAVAGSGACPVIIPPCPDARTVETTLDRLDGIVFSGGADFSPEYLGEEPLPTGKFSFCPERDASEFLLMRAALERQMPVLGICRGEQLLCLAAGGKIWQDLPSQTGSTIHSQGGPRNEASHGVDILPGTLLEGILESKHISVNSFHHQAVREVPPALRIAAYSEDGVVEAVESAQFKPVLGVQWHPEHLTLTQSVNRKIFKWLAEEAALYRTARTIQDKAVSIDFHCDVPMFFDGDYDIFDGGTNARGNMESGLKGGQRQEQVPSRVDLRRMRLAGQDSAVMAAYIRQGRRDWDGFKAAAAKAESLLKELHDRVARCSDVAGIATTPEEIIELKKQGRTAVVPGLENGYALGLDVNLVDRFAGLGIAYVTLCHNGHNDICDSAYQCECPEHNGLSAFGRTVVHRMNRRGILVDVSHASERTFYDVLECSRTPIVASHSSVWSLCRHPRNLKDEQIKMLASAGGVMGICFYGGFLAEGRETTIKDIVAHIRYVSDLVGTDCVGIGSDFDGGGGVIGCDDSSEMVNLTRELLRSGFSEVEIVKILGGNFLRLMETAQSQALKI
ncbi:MAG: membrane dipeptidase [Bacteroidales bacterium]|nr:membrane dipeptidase [Bacteroidales bacterium]